MQHTLDVQAVGQGAQLAACAWFMLQPHVLKPQPCLKKFEHLWRSCDFQQGHQCDWFADFCGHNTIMAAAATAETAGSTHNQLATFKLIAAN